MSIKAKLYITMVLVATLSIINISFNAYIDKEVVQFENLEKSLFEFDVKVLELRKTWKRSLAKKRIWKWS